LTLKELKSTRCRVLAIHNMANEKKLIWLVGSGISIPAKYPSTSQITESVLSGKQLRRYTDESYDFYSEEQNEYPFPDEHVPRILTFLKWIDQLIMNKTGSSTHDTYDYEQLYYIASQVYEHSVGEFHNPALIPLIDKLLFEEPELLSAKEEEVKGTWHLHELAHESINYIRDVVWRKLTIEPQYYDHLKCFADPLQNSEAIELDLFTLNHDTLLEAYFKRLDIPVVDGFGESEYGIRYWCEQEYDVLNAKVKLYKLHGSINWFKFIPDKTPIDWYRARIGHIEDPLVYNISQRGAHRVFQIEGRPLFLAGTYNKTADYSNGIYKQLHCRFSKSLKKSARILVCGYGFRDRGINFQIIEWLYSSRRNRIVLIHPNPGELGFSQKCTNIARWNNWIKDGQLKIVPKKIEDATWQEIEDTL